MAVLDPVWPTLAGDGWAFLAVVAWAVVDAAAGLIVVAVTGCAGLTREFWAAAAVTVEVVVATWPVLTADGSADLATEAVAVVFVGEELAVLA